MSTAPAREEIVATLRAYLAEELADDDPEAMEEAKERHLGSRIEYAPSSLAALENADALILVTEWKIFRRPDFDEVKKLLKQPVVIDGRNIYPREMMEAAGFTYYGLGT